ncbi:hypothetical protein CPT_Suzuki_031 [Stenotrophomonas phage Suzuki]|nr:hypothetical protein CPT_Suzuki_031 [Stenotrophomonas phage Suzuki]
MNVWHPAAPHLIPQGNPARIPRVVDNNATGDTR